MTIIDEIRIKVFQQNSDFLDRLANEWRNINANFLDCHAQNDYEHSFLNILTEEVHEKMPDYTVVPSFRLKAIPSFLTEERAEIALGESLNYVRQRICLPGLSEECYRDRKCFDGEYPSGTEIDALIIHERDFCLLEYENQRQGLCDDFMKIYRLHKLLSRPFESLFVTKVTTRKNEEVSTLESFNRYVEDIRPMLDMLLGDWKLLEIVDLTCSERKRHFHWTP